MKQATVEPKEVKNIKGDSQYYLVVSYEEKMPVYVNVGKRTFDGVKALTDVDAPTLTLNTNEDGKGKIPNKDKVR